MTQTQAPPAPDRIMQLGMGFIASRSLQVACELDVFSHIQAGHNTVEALARVTQCSPRGLRILTDALVGVGLLQRHDKKWTLAPDAEMYLVRSSRAYIGAVLSHANHTWNEFSKLTQAVRSGTGVVDWVNVGDSGAFFSEWVDGLFNLNFPAAQAVAGSLPPTVKNVLDLGAGSGVWSLAVATQRPDVKVTVVDQSAVIDKVSRPFAERMGVVDRYTFKSGNFREVELEPQSYDVVYLGHILHGEGYDLSMTLLKRVHAALRPGGRVVIAEMVCDDARQEAFPLIFAVNMLLLTEAGDTFSRSELEKMLSDTGFTSPQWIQAPAPSPILVGTKA